MKKYILAIVFSLLSTLLFVGYTTAHGLMWHVPTGNRDVTIKFFRQSAGVYEILSGKVIKNYHEANYLLESGVVAELDGKSNVELFRKSLVFFEKMSENLDELIVAQGKLIQIEAEEIAGKKGISVKAFDDALENILAEFGPLEIPGRKGARYALTAGGEKIKHRPDLKTISDILSLQIKSMHVLKRKSEVAIDAMRSAIPLAEKEKFVPVMLSGRNAFGDIMPQFVDLFSAFDRLYVKTCLATISATMQVYPEGWEWLSKR